MTPTEDGLWMDLGSLLPDRLWDLVQKSDNNHDIVKNVFHVIKLSQDLKTSRTLSLLRLSLTGL